VGPLLVALIQWLRLRPALRGNTGNRQPWNACPLSSDCARVLIVRFGCRLIGELQLGPAAGPPPFGSPAALEQPAPAAPGQKKERESARGHMTFLGSLVPQSHQRFIIQR